MPLQNRVDPFGDIHATPERGMFTGNRGIIHDPDTRTLLKRRWTSKAWIICRCEYKGRHRQVMGRGAWTELFFLDEVTALAAGHRPCFECRRDAAREFATSFGEGSGSAVPKAGEMDGRLHKERLASGGEPSALTPAALADLPDGTVVAVDRKAFALRDRQALPWSFAGYGKPRPLDLLARGEIRLLTPPATVAALRAGYKPVWHASASCQFPEIALP